MNRLLVPIDFTPSSANALKYAFHLAKVLQMDLVLIHCYAEQDFNRRFDFGKKDYASGVKEMLAAFFKEQIGAETEATRFVAVAGSLVQTLTKLSNYYPLIVISSNNFNSPLQKWLGSKVAVLAATAQCPVLIIPPTLPYKEWKTIWHFKRQDNERTIIEKKLKSLKINTKTIQAKSLDQSVFSSPLWRAVVSFTKAPSEPLSKTIATLKESENLDLILLVSHGKYQFQNFLQTEIMRIISKFNIPVLVFQE